MPDNTPRFTPIRQPRVLREIIDQIKDNIAAGQLSKGDRLPSERQMEEIFGVSRTTVREVVKSLELMGLVECVQGDGNYIAKNLDNSLTQPLSIMFLLENGTVLQIQQLRRSLELTTARLAAMCIEDGQKNLLEDICRQMERNYPESRLTQFDKRFHYEIAAAAGNPLIAVILNAAESLIAAQIQDVREHMLRQPGRLEKINRQHRDVLDALSAGDSAGAVRAMERHMDFIEEFLLK